METIKEEPLNYYLDPANVFPIEEMNDPRFREWMAKNWAPPTNVLSEAQRKRIKRAKFFKTALIKLSIGIFVAGIAVATGGSALGALGAAAAAVGAETVASGLEEKEAEKEMERLSKDIRNILENLGSSQPIAPSLH